MKTICTCLFSSKAAPCIIQKITHETKNKHMKKLSFLLCISFLMNTAVHAQNWFTTGNSGLTNSNFLGTTDNQDLIFKAKNKERGRLISAAGAWRFGTATNNAQIDSTGKLTFAGTGVYQVGGNKYAFQYSGNPNYGLFFNLTNVQYEFRNGSAIPVFSVKANTGDAVFNGSINYNGELLSNSVRILGNTSTNTYIGLKAGLNNTTGDNNTFVGNSSGFYNTTGYSNTADGYSALYFNTTGTNNTAIGNVALNNNQTGSQNVAVGSYALVANTTGSGNTATGQGALEFNTTGENNTGTGNLALLLNTTGNKNTASGFNSMYSNTTGSDNTASGYRAMYSNTTGINNTATGIYSLYSNTIGSANTAYGSNSLNNNTTGLGNTANGSSALYLNTTASNNTASGFNAMFLNTTGDNNIATGYYALYNNTTGNANAATGLQALYSNTTGYQNTATGENALYKNATGFFNTGEGYSAGSQVTTGNNNTFLGYNANTSTATIVNSTALGANASVTSDNNFVFGNSSVVKWGFGKQTGSTNIIDFANTTAKLTTGGVWTNASDKKLKDNFQQLDRQDILNKIAKLDIQRWHYIKDSSNITHIGPVAQDFYAAFKVGDDTTISTIDPAGIALLGLQALKKENDDLKSEIDELKTVVQTLQKSYESCNPCAAGSSSTPNNPQQTANLSSASLLQNIPNPFQNTTTINYVLPKQFSSAKIIITDKNGSVLKQLNLTGNSKGSINVNTSTLASGAYQYTLYVDGKMMDSKQMVLAR